MTIAQAHSLAKTSLIAAGYSSQEAHASARILLDEIAHVPHAHLSHPDRVLDAEQEARFARALQELCHGRPLAYVLGRREFFGLEFRCDERALVPRPDTEVLVEAALQILNSKPEIRNPKLADLGTGTGCIAIALAKSLPQAELYATDVSPAALELARENAVTHSVAGRVHFIAGVRGDWAVPLREYSGRFDILVSNPPYIAPRDIEHLQVQVRHYEPRSALDGGEDGLDCYRQLAAQCKVLLKPGGTLLCELGAGQFEEVRAIFENVGWKVEEPIYDFAGIERVLVARRAEFASPVF